MWSVSASNVSLSSARSIWLHIMLVWLIPNRWIGAESDRHFCPLMYYKYGSHIQTKVYHLKLLHFSSFRLSLIQSLMFKFLNIPPSSHRTARRNSPSWNLSRTRTAHCVTWHMTLRFSIWFPYLSEVLWDYQWGNTVTGPYQSIFSYSEPLISPN